MNSCHPVHGCHPLAFAVWKNKRLAALSSFPCYTYSSTHQFSQYRNTNFVSFGVFCEVLCICLPQYHAQAYLIRRKNKAHTQKRYKREDLSFDLNQGVLLWRIQWVGCSTCRGEFILAITSEEQAAFHNYCHVIYPHAGCHFQKNTTISPGFLYSESNCYNRKIAARCIPVCTKILVLCGNRNVLASLSALEKWIDGSYNL